MLPKEWLAGHQDEDSALEAFKQIPRIKRLLGRWNRAVPNGVSTEHLEGRRFYVRSFARLWLRPSYYCCGCGCELAYNAWNMKNPPRRCAACIRNKVPSLQYCRNCGRVKPVRERGELGPKFKCSDCVRIVEEF